MNKKSFFAMLPSVDEVLNNKKIQVTIEKYPRGLVTESIREAIDFYRNRIIKLKEDEAEKFEINLDVIVEKTIFETEEKYEISLKKVVNATGIVIHTNLGRSLLSEEIVEDVVRAATRYSNLEYDIQKGHRGSRYDHLTNMIKRITGAEDVLIVNNNAAAVMLILSTMAKGGEAIVSRGELVEVGGSFRIPSIMELSGAKLVEVGATNKTHYNDYEDAISENTKVLMKVHTSNYRVVGFSESISLEQMKEMGEKHNLPVIEDLGSGVLVDFAKYDMSHEPTVMDSLQKGVDIVSFSGDKMLGGPQAGIIVGKSKYIEKMKKNQLTRALRVDKLTICALEATLRLYLEEEKAMKAVPTMKMLTYTDEELSERALKLCNLLKETKVDATIYVEDGMSQVGGGSMPTELLPSKVVCIEPKTISVAKLEEKLRLSKSHIIARVYENKYVLDIRTIFEDEYKVIANELIEAVK